MPGIGTSTRQPSSVACTWNDGDEPAAGPVALRVGRSLQNWLKRRSTSRWKLNTSSNEFQRVRPNIANLLKNLQGSIPTCLSSCQVSLACHSQYLDRDDAGGRPQRFGPARYADPSAAW